MTNFFICYIESDENLLDIYNFNIYSDVYTDSIVKFEIFAFVLTLHMKVTVNLNLKPGCLFLLFLTPLAFILVRSLWDFEYVCSKLSHDAMTGHRWKNEVTDFRIETRSDKSSLYTTVRRKKRVRIWEQKRVRWVYTGTGRRVVEVWSCSRNYWKYSKQHKLLVLFLNDIMCLYYKSELSEVGCTQHVSAA